MKVVEASRMPPLIEQFTTRLQSCKLISGISTSISSSG